MSASSLSVVICNYNHGPFIGENLQAILSQSLRPTELIVIDDGSTDNSLAIIEPFAQREPIIRLVRNERNRGIQFSVNRGLALASGDYVHFLGADDRVLPGFYEKSLKLLAQHPQAGICFAFSRLVGENGEELGVIPRNPVISGTARFVSPEEASTLLLPYDGWTVDDTAILRRAALLEVGGFLPELRSHCSKFAYKVIALKHGVCFIPEPLAVHRWAANSYSSTTANDLDAVFDIMHHAGQLMRSTYRDLFPPDSVADWERRWLFYAGLRLISTSRSAQETRIAGLGRLLSPTLADRAFLAALRWATAAEFRLTRLYLLSQVRGASLWPLLGQKLRHLLRRLAG